MTKQDLEQVYWLRKELRTWQRKLNELQADIAISPKAIDGMPFQHTNKNSSPTEDKAVKLAEYDKIIKGKIAEIQVAVREVDAFIVTIEDSFTRQILEARCCQCKTWNQIAAELSSETKDFSEDAIKQRYHRFVENLN